MWNGEVDSATFNIGNSQIRRLDKTGNKSKPIRPDPSATSDIGLSAKDLRNYSIVRAIRAAANAKQGETRSWQDAGLELDASKAVEQRTGVPAQGFYIPSDLLDRRDLVGTDVPANVIELLRNRLILNTAGITILTGLVGDMAIPRQSSAGTGYWVGEGVAPTESQQGIDQVALTPHTVGAFTDYSRKLIKQSSVGVERFVRSDLAVVLALAIDYAGLHGDDSEDANQPDGVASISGVGSVVGGTNGANPRWGYFVSLETEVAADNADVGRLSYIMNAKVRGYAKQTQRVAGTDSRFLWGDDARYPVNGYPVHVSNQVRSDMDKGTSTGVCSGIFFGNWADLVLGMWGGLDIVVALHTFDNRGRPRYCLAGSGFRSAACREFCRDDGCSDQLTGAGST